jgi:hypothetical protein
LGISCMALLYNSLDATTIWPAQLQSHSRNLPSATFRLPIAAYGLVCK